MAAAATANYNHLQLIWTTRRHANGVPWLITSNGHRNPHADALFEPLKKDQKASNVQILN